MLLINCKLELTFKWKKYFDLSPSGADNTDANHNKLFLLSKT